MLAKRQLNKTIEVLLLGLFYISAVSTVPSFAQEANKIRVAIFLDTGAHARPQIFSTMREDPTVSATIINGEDVREDCLKNFDVLFMPGGSGKKEAFSLGESGQEKVIEFVKNGGIYVGVCAGCYLASCSRSPYLGLLPATTRDKEHWQRGKAILPIEFTKLGMEVFGVDKANYDVLYHNGPILKIYKDDEDKVIPLCYFRGEKVAPGGTPGVMINAPAMVLGGYGKGLVLGISPHPEAGPELKGIELHAIHWLYKRRLENMPIVSENNVHQNSASQTSASYLSQSSVSHVPAVSKPSKPASQVPFNTLSQPIYNKAEAIFQRVTKSHYEHLHEGVNEQVQQFNGNYETTTDCSGFVSYVINSVAPKHYAVIYDMTGSTYPHARTYATLFSELNNDEPTDGWLKVASYRDLQRGDIIAWERMPANNESHRRNKETGHVMIVINPPGKTIIETVNGVPVRYVEVYVLDSSSVEHFPPQVLPPNAHQNHRDGIGKGTIRLILDNQDKVIGFWEGTFSHERNTEIQGPSYTNKIGFARLISLLHNP